MAKTFILVDDGLISARRPAKRKYKFLVSEIKTAISSLRGGFRAVNESNPLPAQESWTNPKFQKAIER